MEEDREEGGIMARRGGCGLDKRTEDERDWQEVKSSV